MVKVSGRFLSHSLGWRDRRPSPRVGIIRSGAAATSRAPALSRDQGGRVGSNSPRLTSVWIRSLTRWAGGTGDCDLGWRSETAMSREPLSAPS